MKIGIILTPAERSKAYLQKLVNNKVTVDEIIFLNDNRKETIFPHEAIQQSKLYGFDISISVQDFLKEKNLKFKEFNFVDINHPNLINYLKSTSTKYYIFSGGGILRNEILDLEKKFVHLHPGLVPFYRGSTCFYYSIINDDNCGVTAFIMDKHLDTGKIVYQKTFEKPNHVFVDDVYDSYIRSQTLIEILKKNLLEKEEFKDQNPLDGETYYIIHPVLKHIAILS